MCVHIHTYIYLYNPKKLKALRKEGERERAPLLASRDVDEEDANGDPGGPVFKIKWANKVAMDGFCQLEALLARVGFGPCKVHKGVQTEASATCPCQQLQVTSDQGPDLHSAARGGAPCQTGLISWVRMHSWEQSHVRAKVEPIR